MKRDDGRAGPVPAEQVIRIRKRAAVAHWLRELLKHQPTLEKIAASEGVTLRVVRSIVSGQRYKWVRECRHE
jgi:uncharacterized NAD-dependent epimerase/dehydratase family protein